MRWVVLTGCLLFLGSMVADELSSPSPAGAEVYFITPANGDVVSNPVTVRFGLRGMGVTPAGHEADNTGHHHILIDLDELPAMELPLPKSDNVVHFGGGQTETELNLPPGKHKLQLLLGNHLHVPHQPPVISQRIEITVR